MADKQNISQESDKLTGVRGQVLTFKADPFLTDEESCYDYWTDALVVIQHGRIADVGDYTSIRRQYPTLADEDIDTYSDAVIMPGFIDCHVHYVQTPMIASCGDTLLDWLNRYTYPTESRFRDKEFASEVAHIFFNQMISHGTTTANVFATTFEESVDAFFEESERCGARMICGKVLQDRNLPEQLRDADAESSVAIAERLMEKWHGRGRQLYAIIPRFAPTSTPLQLRLAGELYQRNLNRGVYMHTHLDEAESEIQWVRQLFPHQATYTDVYRHFGLVGRNSIFAHCCIVREDEWDVLHRNDCGAVHCPSSNLFLGDAEFRYWEAKKADRPVNVAIGTDVGGGTNFSVLRQLGEAYKVAMLHSRSLSAIHSFYLATRGGAETLHLAECIGSIQPGYEADLTVVNLHPDDFTAWRMRFCSDIFEQLFVLTALAPDRLTVATYIAGHKLFHH